MDFYSRSSMSNAINEFIPNQRYREVLLLRFCDGHTYEEISGITCYSTQHVKHICNAYKELLMDCL